MIKPNFFSPIPAAASQTEMNMAMSWVSLEKFSVELIHWNILCESRKVFSRINRLEYIYALVT